MFTQAIGTAAMVVVDVASLNAALLGAQSEQDSVQRLILQKIEQELQQSPLEFSDGELIYTDSVSDQVVEDGCTSTLLQSMQTNIVLDRRTELALSFESLFDPLRISLDLGAQVEITGRAKQTVGVRLGNCVDLATDSFSFSANGPLRLQVELAIFLNPQWKNERTLQVRPAVALNGQLTEGQVVVSVDDSLLRGLLENYLQGRVDDLLGAGAIQQEIASLQQRLDSSLRESLEESDGVVDLELPPADDDQIVALYELLTPQSRFPLTASFLQANRLQLLAALITDNSQALDDILANAAECQLGGVLEIPLARAALFSNASGACEQAVGELIDGTRYASDSACVLPFDYIETDQAGFCSLALDSNRLGNAQSNMDALGKWTLSPATAFEFGVLSLAGKQQPFTQRARYKNVETGAGECALEMRIYSRAPLISPQKSLIALHGGSWQRRGSGFLGVEHMATHFANAGYVVFAPFYRLVGEADGPAVCQNASLEDIVADVNDALDWVSENQQRFGASGKPAVFGQSAGGHLALSLAVDRPAEVASVVLFYAPTDFADFANQVRSGAYNNEQGRRIIEAVTAAPLDSIDISSDLIRTNSFPQRVVQAGSMLPPMFMLHGEADELLPARQSKRLCNSLSGNPDVGPADGTTRDLRRSVACDDRGSQLHLITQGEHTLDLCVSPTLCLAGSEASAKETAYVVQRMLDWVDSPADVSVEPSGGSGGVEWWLILWIHLLCQIRALKCKLKDTH